MKKENEDKKDGIKVIVTEENQQNLSKSKVDGALNV